jgi:hypothetical protein
MRSHHRNHLKNLSNPAYVYRGGFSTPGRKSSNANANRTDKPRKKPNPKRRSSSQESEETIGVESQSQSPVSAQTFIDLGAFSLQAGIGSFGQLLSHYVIANMVPVDCTLSFPEVVESPTVQSDDDISWEEFVNTD